MALYGLAGFQALSLEIIWFRLLSVIMKASAFTFGTLLTIFLTGLGVGAALGSVFVRNVRNPARAFLLLQGFVGLYAGVSVLVLIALLPSSTGIEGLYSYLAGYEPLHAASAFASLIFGEEESAAHDVMQLHVWLPLVIVGPPTLAMGASFPLVQKVVLVRMNQIGTRVGLVLLRMRSALRARTPAISTRSVIFPWSDRVWHREGSLLRGGQPPACRTHSRLCTHTCSPLTISRSGAKT